MQSAADGFPLPFALVSHNSVTINPICVDEKGDIFIVDNEYTHAVYEYRPGSRKWIIAAGGNGQGTAPNQLNNPLGIVVDPAGNLYVADRYNHRVQKWAPGAASGITVAGGNGPGDDDSHLGEPAGLAMDCNGDLYISDYSNQRVLRWTPGAPSGTVVAGGNGRGAALNQLNDPIAVGLDLGGNLYVAEQLNARISKWVPGATAGTIVVQGNGSGNAADPAQISDLWVDANGNCYFMNYPGNRIIEWAPGAGGGNVIYNTDNIGTVFAAYVDNSGAVWGMCSTDNRLEKLAVEPNIDNKLMPVASGHYWAVITDINGYTTNTDTIPITTPPPATPTISITATATTIGLCTPVTFTANTTNAGLSPLYQWELNTLSVGADSNVYTNNIFGNGDHIDCILTAVGQDCQLVHDTSNIITLTVDPQNHATVSITASDTATCIGTPIDLTATVTNGTANPGLEWYVNGSPTAITTPQFVDSATGNQVVYCEITSDASCGLARSNSIPIAIYPAPSIPPGQIFYLPYGKDESIDPLIDGAVATYLWTPSTGLSDSTAATPIITAPETRTYTLKVTSPGGCKASGLITVDVYTPLEVPNAFTPNGDGHNDLFYILGGPQGSTIKEFAIFDRWGEKRFDIHNGVPGDPRFGWNGNYNGHPAAPGTYAYIAVIATPDGHQNVYKGTLVLIR